MKLVEVVILVGSQCISPLQQAPHATEAGKVDCAVLIHRDTETGAFAVVPPGAYGHPEVRMALQRSLNGGAAAPAPKVVADAPPQPPEPEAAPPPPRTTVIEPQPAEEPDQPAEASVPVSEQQQIASAEEPPASRKIDARYPEPAADTGDVVDLTQAAADAADAADGSDAGQAEETVVAVEESPAAGTEAPKAKPAAKSKSKSLTKRSSKQRTAARTVPAPAGYRDKCGKTRVARWYTNKSGNKKYRCVLPGKNNFY